MEVVARILRDTTVVAAIPLAYAGQTSIFVGTWRPAEPGTYVVEVLAMDPAAANFGRHRRTIRVIP